ncbi:ABC transporter permease subunit [Alkalihalobacillus sp. LMS39]|uniref:ABC transporter permease n=1 Tax=Alkalihalobacillus sp. LMS39 TaxID=2924032 RepID=UPI001FB311C3|nr:ABC transporter permease subunit [Alkalihalobacillus sp. LMS39]UOE92068.1 ABC transporter permease subunit [Alkalihalobacillus sp. LMS39]
MNNQLKIAIVLLGLLICFCLLSFVDPILQPEEERLEYILTDDGQILIPPYPPSEQFWLGTDQNGRDIFTYLVKGGLNTLVIVFVISFIRFVFAVPLGILAYKRKGISHSIIHGFNSFFSMVPILFIAILVLNLPMVLVSDHRLLLSVVLIALLECGAIAVAVQNHVRQIYQSSYMEGAIVNGSSKLTVAKYYYWRHVRSHVIIMFFLDAAKVMLLLGQLGFLSMFLSQDWIYDESVGIVVRNTLEIWPTMLADTRQYLRSDIWIPLFPAFMIAYTIFSLQMLGEGLRKHFERKKQ